MGMPTYCLACLGQPAAPSAKLKKPAKVVMAAAMA